MAKTRREDAAVRAERDAVMESVTRLVGAVREDADPLVIGQRMAAVRFGLDALVDAAYEAAWGVG